MSKSHALIGGTDIDMEANLSGCRCFCSAVPGYFGSLINWLRTLCCCTKNALYNIQTILVFNTIIVLVLCSLVLVLSSLAHSSADMSAGQAARSLPGMELLAAVGDLRAIVAVFLLIIFAGNWAFWYGMVWREKPCCCFLFCYTEDGCCGMDPRRLAGNLLIFFSLLEVGLKVKEHHEVNGEIDETFVMLTCVEAAASFLVGCCLRSVPNGAPGLESDVYRTGGAGGKRGMVHPGHTESSDEEQDSEGA